MMYADRIKPTDRGIGSYLEDLIGKAYQIPTFQREVVWEKGNVKKLWDSIYKFYPLGSILIWKTNVRLQNHRSIGGHVITDESTRPEYQYILDGQQRTTSLLTSIYGGEIEGRKGFDPTLYIDLSVGFQGDTDEESYKERFLFWDEIDDRNGKLRQNTPKKKRYVEGLIVTLKNVKENFGSVERKLVEGGHSDYDHLYRSQLRRIKEVLDNYRISIIELRGIQVSEVCQIFERINQAGMLLGIFDIVVAKTFRLKTNLVEGFYLREVIDQFRKSTEGKYVEIDDQTYLQILAVLIRGRIPDSRVQNITEKYLINIRTEDLETLWPEARKAILKSFDFLENHLRLKGPNLIPFRYFYMTLASYFFENAKPNYDFLKKYFWFYSFHNEDLLSNTTHLWQHVEFMSKEKNNGTPAWPRFLIDKNSLRTSSYSSRGRLSRAILSLFANQGPRDWKHPDRLVLSEVYYLLTDKPNLHHIFPSDFIAKNPGRNRLDSDSLMNIAYLTQIANLEISNKNPINYLKTYDTPQFTNVIGTHLLPNELIEWSRMENMPGDALDQFIELRLDILAKELRPRLEGIRFEIIDTKEKTENDHRVVPLSR